MPTVNEDHGPEKWPILSRIFHSYKSMLALLAVVQASEYVIYPMESPGWSAAVLLTSSILSLTVILAVVKHGERLCEQCMAKVPADAQEQAQRLRRGFWLAHQTLFAPVWKTMAVCGVFMLVNSAINALVVDWDYRWITQIPVDILFLTVIYMGWNHGRYRPWCPYCRNWGDGGPEEVVPDPDPVVEKEKVH